MAVANQLHSAHHALTDKLTGRQDLPEHYTLDLFYQSVKSSSDVQDFILRTAARLNLPIKWLPDRIAEQNFNLDEPPTKASAWVGVLLNQHLKVFRERLSTMPTLSTADIDQVRHALCTSQVTKRKRTVKMKSEKKNSLRRQASRREALYPAAAQDCKKTMSRKSAAADTCHCNNINALLALCYCRTWGFAKRSLHVCVCVCAHIHL